MHMKHLRRAMKKAVVWGLDQRFKFAGHYHMDVWQSYVSGWDSLGRKHKHSNDWALGHSNPQRSYRDKESNKVIWKGAADAIDGKQGVEEGSLKEKSINCV